MKLAQSKNWTTERPKPQRVQVTARDPDKNRSQHLTLYGATVEEVIALLKAGQAQRNAAAQG